MVGPLKQVENQCGTDETRSSCHNEFHVEFDSAGRVGWIQYCGESFQFLPRAVGLPVCLLSSWLANVCAALKLV